jgi:hypothetical protein
LQLNDLRELERQGRRRSSEVTSTTNNRKLSDRSLIGQEEQNNRTRNIDRQGIMNSEHIKGTEAEQE